MLHTQSTLFFIIEGNVFLACRANEINTQEQHDFLLGRAELALPEELAALIHDEAGSADDAVVFASPSRSLGM